MKHRFRCLLLVAAGAWHQQAWCQVPHLNTDFNTDRQIQLYQSWVAKDPSDISSLTLLAGAYVQKTRETTDLGYLQRASKILDTVLAKRQDREALHLRNIVELTMHEFPKAAEDARALTVSWPGDTESWGTYGDAMLEMGQYDQARDAFAKMLAIKPGLTSYNRMGFYRFVNGDVTGGIDLMQHAVKAAAKYPENKAWCLVELGNMYFKTGKWAEAKTVYQDAVTTFPASHQAHAGLGSVAAAEGKMTEAIADYKHAQAITPMVQYAGALYDLYRAEGKNAEAREQADLIDLEAKLEAAAGLVANRTLGLMYANEDRELAKSLDLIQTDFKVRKDIYTYDALSWILYKNKQYDEARKASAEALKTGAPEALFFYHAGMIADALGDTGAAKKQLAKALELNAGFDFGQAAIARQALDRLQGAKQ